MKQILLLSDTHNYFDENIRKHALQVDEVWHAGDVGTLSVIEELEKCAKLRAVYGNIDSQEIRQQYPKDNHFMCEEVSVFMTHIGGYPNRYESRVKEILAQQKIQLFIAGHSHILKVIYDKKLSLLHMNPGAIGIYGNHIVRTMLKFVIEGNQIRDLHIIEYNR